MQEFRLLQSKSQEHGEWKISMKLIKLFASLGKKKPNEFFTVVKLLLMLSLIKVRSFSAVCNSSLWRRAGFCVGSLIQILENSLSIEVHNLGTSSRGLGSEIITLTNRKNK